MTQVPFTETRNCRKEGAGEEALVLHGFPLETAESTFPGADCILAGRGLNGVPGPCVRVKYSQAPGCCPFSCGRAGVLELVLEDPDAQCSPLCCQAVGAPVKKAKQLHRGLLKALVR